MKKLLALILITLSASAMAGHPGFERQVPRAQGYGHHHHGHDDDEDDDQFRSIQLQ